jgi:hypothetical protein
MVPNGVGEAAYKRIAWLGLQLSCHLRAAIGSARKYERRSGMYQQQQTVALAPTRRPIWRPKCLHPIKALSRDTLPRGSRRFWLTESNHFV